jgi:hypothetical protein
MEGANVQSSSLEATRGRHRLQPKVRTGSSFHSSCMRSRTPVGLLPVSCTGRTSQPSRLSPGRQPQPVDARACVTDPL